MAERKKGILQEFKEFALEGNVLELAIAFILGLYFKQVVDALVNGVILNARRRDLRRAELRRPDVHSSATASSCYGTFITAIVTFLIVAAALFVIVKAFDTAKELQKRGKPGEPPEKRDCPLCFTRDLRRRRRAARRAPGRFSRSSPDAASAPSASGSRRRASARPYPPSTNTTDPQKNRASGPSRNCDERGELLGGPLAADRDRERVDELADRRVLPRRLEQRRLDRPGRDDVERDPRAGPVLGRRVPAHPPRDRGLRRRVRRHRAGGIRGRAGAPARRRRGRARRRPSGRRAGTSSSWS